ncbi:unnamed protein product, partial [Brenthis ino]
MEKSYKYDKEKPVITQKEMSRKEKPKTEKIISKPEKPVQKKIETGDLVPKVVKLPNNWNLEKIELKLDIKNAVKDANTLISPDDHLDSEWEVI